ncbi:MAG: glycosyltransferase family 4 protein [Deltaproteobacteria bacterium]|nr:glycosyltransferase family 4 protein [Deltaproteobacteria bacterium]
MSRDKADRLRVCLLSYRSHPHCGGQGVYIYNLSRALKDLGHHVEVVSGPPIPQLDKDIKLFQLPGLDLYNPDDLFRMPSLKELSDPINLMEWLGVSTMGFPEPFTFGLRAYRFLRKRRHKYDIVHDNQSLSYSIKSIKVIGMQKRVARTLSHIITVSQAAKNDISKNFGIPQERFKVIMNGINTDLFYPVSEIRREKGRIIVTSSSDTPIKGLRYLLEAVAEISKTLDVRLVIVGTVKKNGDIEKLIKNLGIKERIAFTGRIDNEAFVQQYARASLAIVPSVYEGFGFPAGEAMACGLPVVSTTGGALPEVVGDAGVLVPPANSRELVNAITQLLENPEQAEKMGRAGFNRVHHRFSWKKAAEMTAAAYRETIRDYHRF